MSNSTIDTIDTFVRSFVQIYVLLILVWVVLGYFRLPYNVWLSRIRRFLDDTVQPYLRLWRRILPMFGPLDLSPMVGVIALLAGEQILISVIDGFRP
jgi:YggT family protein